MDFNLHLADIDVAIDAYLRGDAWIRPLDGGADYPVRVAIEHPVEAERLGEFALVRTKPWVEVSVASAPVLKKGDKVLMGAVAPFTGWTVASQPLRPGDGRQWRADLDPLGVVAA